MEKEKENWNEKLFVLLNEYDNCWDYCSEYGFYMPGMDRDAYWYHKYYLISKEYGFIQWLVDNDKIDLWNEEYECYWNEMYKDTNTTDAIIMELSISDTPIDDLVSYLKNV